jgi:hypothetical protein
VRDEVGERELVVVCVLVMVMVEVGDREVEVEGEPLREKRPVLVTEADGLLVGELVLVGQWDTVGQLEELPLKEGDTEPDAEGVELVDTVGHWEALVDTVGQWDTVGQAEVEPDTVAVTLTEELFDGEVVADGQWDSEEECVLVTVEEGQ